MLLDESTMSIILLQSTSTQRLLSDAPANHLVNLRSVGSGYETLLTNCWNLVAWIRDDIWLSCIPCMRVCDCTTWFSDGGTQSFVIFLLKIRKIGDGGVFQLDQWCRSYRGDRCAWLLRLPLFRCCYCGCAGRRVASREWTLVIFCNVAKKRMAHKKRKEAKNSHNYVDRWWPLVLVHIFLQDTLAQNIFFSQWRWPSPYHFADVEHCRSGQASFREYIGLNKPILNLPCA